ncbi:MAG: ribosome small subunit-dependent GTPase A, partial [Heliobacteriaceae bacterium]|nr:ribosome small subunit-dependent GTPase A [Heliobacteriaceae bacterium]
QIYKIHSDFYYVDDGEKTYECKIREVLKKRREKIYVGDFVEFADGVIESVMPRKNYIPRPSVANIDQIIIVSALKEPDLDLNQLNRYIALAKYYNIPVKLCFNKDDLLAPPDFLDSVYSGFEIVFTSAKEKNGLEPFQKLLEGKITVLCGNSGAGKSSLINAMTPGLNLKTKAVSEKNQRGVHTTRHCEIIKLSTLNSPARPPQLSTRVVDTPGFSNVKFDFLLPQEVSGLFDEFSQYTCKFSDCLHLSESGCGVLENLDKIHPGRYESYLQFVEEARGYKEKVKYEGTKTETAQKISGCRTAAKISGKKRQSARNTSKQKVYEEWKTT